MRKFQDVRGVEPEEAAERFAKRLHDTWGVGDPACNNGADRAWLPRCPLAPNCVLVYVTGVTLSRNTPACGPHTTPPHHHPTPPHPFLPGYNLAAIHLHVCCAGPACCFKPLPPCCCGVSNPHAIAPGVLYFLALENRQVYISTGKGTIRRLTDDLLDDILDDVRPMLKKGE